MYSWLLALSYLITNTDVWLFLPPPELPLSFYIRNYNKYQKTIHYISFKGLRISPFSHLPADTASTKLEFCYHWFPRTLLKYFISQFSFLNLLTNLRTLTERAGIFSQLVRAATWVDAILTAALCKQISQQQAQFPAPVRQEIRLCTDLHSAGIWAAFLFPVSNNLFSKVM